MVDPGHDAIEFLRSAGWTRTSIEPIAGDMSTRRYFRVDNGTSSAVLMVAKTSMRAFVQMTEWLSGAELSVPAILHDDADKGLLLLEDFGSRSVKSILVEEQDKVSGIFDDCVCLLLKIRATKPPDLPSPDVADLIAWTRLTDEYYPGLVPGRLDEFREVLSGALENALAGSQSVSLRDFHTENMMWLPNRKDYRRLGLLDYQDAMLTHPAYDLMSLLTDARTWIPETLRENVIASYLAHSGDDEESFRAAFAALSAQRNLRILGVFIRAGRHIEHLPNTYRYFVEALSHPAFDTVREDVLSALPPPEGFE